MKDFKSFDDGAYFCQTTAGIFFVELGQNETKEEPIWRAEGPWGTPLMEGEGHDSVSIEEALEEGLEESDNAASIEEDQRYMRRVNGV